MTLLVLYPKVLFSRRMIPVYVYAFICILMFNTFLVDIDPLSKKRIWNEVLSIFTAISILFYFFESQDFEGLNLTVRITLLFIIISIITSLIGISIYPMAARELAGSLIRDGAYDIIQTYNRIGIGGYGFFVVIALLTPIPIAMYRLSYKTRRDKIFLVISSGLLFYTLFQAQYLANIIVGIVTYVFVILGKRFFKHPLMIFVIVLFLVFIIPDSFYTAIINFVANITGKVLIKEKLLDINYFIIGGNTAQTGVDVRMNRVPILLNSFFQNPFIGGGIENAHLHWLNKLSVYGLFITVPYFVILYRQYKFNVKRFNDTYKFIYTIILISFLGLGSVKSLLGWEIHYLIYFILPGIYYLKENKYLAEINSNKNI